jgi:arylsulfatase A-like enzyme
MKYARTSVAALLVLACSDPETVSPDTGASNAGDAGRSSDGARDVNVDGAVDAVVDGVTGTQGLDAVAAVRRPNILLIVADDLGFSDLGAFGGEISTPNLDTLAAEGRILTGHRSGSLCSPTRAMITSGTDSHLVGVGRQGGGTGPQVGKPGYEGYLNDRSLSIAELLRDAGYHTYIAGKWHLGDGEDRSPRARGYESSFVLLPGVATFFNELAEPPTEAQAKLYRDNGVHATPPKDFYATNFYTDKLISYIEANRADGKPFFAFAAYTAPHWPLQAPPEYIDRYRGRYDAGYEVIRAQRIARQKALGIIPQAFEASPLLPTTDGNPKSWAALTEDQRKDQARRMEIYAAMVENLDANVGRLIRHLKSKGEYDNTFIFFQSDNGAEGGDRDTFVDVSHTGPVDNSLANLGRKGSYVGYGPRWAEVGATPFRLWKSYSTEGGIAVPAIARLPRQHEGRVSFGGVTHITDLAPTFLELAGVTAPGSVYKGKPRPGRCTTWPPIGPKAKISRPPDPSSSSS